MPIVFFEPTLVDKHSPLEEQVACGEVPGHGMHAHSRQQGDFCQTGSQITASEDDDVLPGESFRFHP